MPHLAVENARRIHYERFDGAGAPIVLVHGWAVDSRCWTSLFPALRAADVPVVTIDHRCCGRSDADFDDVSVQAIANDVVKVLDALDVDRAVLDGWSLGGAVVVAAAAQLRERAAGLVLTGAATPRYTRADDFPYGGTDADVRATLGAIEADRAGTFANVARAVFAAEPDAALLRSVAEMFLASSPRAGATLLDLAMLDQRALLRTIAAPTWIAHGTADAFVPIETARAAAALLPNARLTTYPNCGHAPFLEAAADYARDLVAFLDGVRHAAP